MGLSHALVCLQAVVQGDPCALKLDFKWRALIICSCVKCLAKAVTFSLFPGREGSDCTTTPRHSFTTSNECK